jgi:hypothetical protein
MFTLPLAADDEGVEVFTGGVATATTLAFAPVEVDPQASEISVIANIKSSRIYLFTREY